MPLKRKIELIDAVEKRPAGKKKKEIAQEFGIVPNTLSTILKDKDKYRQAFYGGQTNISKQRQRAATHDDIDEELLRWFSSVRSENVAVSGPILASKADSLAKELGYDDWKCSAGWLDRFKKRHDIVFKKVCGESKAVNTEDTDQWRNDILPKLLEGYRPKDVFNADETGIFWRLLPDKTLAFKGETCSGGKRSKERVTAMVCANSDGSEKYPLLVLGKFKNPRCFKGIKQLPTTYDANSKAWMTNDIFTAWLRKFDRGMHQQGRKVLLFVDNCPAHPHVSNLKATNLIFLPPNTTAELQPCDQGIINSLKCHYRKEVMRQLLLHIDGGGTTEDFTFSLLDAITKLRNAWNSVTQQTIANCFTKAGMSVHNPASRSGSNEDIISQEFLQRLKDRNIVGDTFEADDFVAVDENLAVSSLENQTVVRSVEQDLDVSDDDDDDCGIPVVEVSSTTALAALATVRVYFMQQDRDVDSTPLLSKVERIIEDVALSKKVQTNILAYLRPQ